MIVDIGVGPPHRTPESGKAGIEEAQPVYAGVGLVALEDTGSAELLAVGLPVIENNEADAVSTSDEFLAEENLLALGAADVDHIFSLRERRVGLWRDKAYRRAFRY